MPTLWEIEADFIRFLAEMKHVGIKIDREFCKPKVKIGTRICNEIRAELGWNPGSPVQLGKFLLGEMGYPVLKRTENGNPSFDKYALEEYEELLEADGSDVAKKVIRYRGWQKTVSSNYKAYLEFAGKNDVIHPEYKIHGTKTCRISCEKPNLQQIPKETEKEWNGDLKRAFIPRLGYVLVEFDFAQLEARLGAAVAKDIELLKAFNNDVDVFQVMADKLQWPRNDYKLLTYMLSYGAGPGKVALVFKKDISEASQMITEYFTAHPNLRIKADIATAIAKEKGYIQYWTGRRRHFGSKGHHKAWNAYIQGGGYEIVKRAGLRLRTQINWPIVLTVHDSYVVEMPTEHYTEENCKMIQNILEDVPEAPEMGVKFKVSYKKWGEKE